MILVGWVLPNINSYAAQIAVALSAALHAFGSKGQIGQALGCVKNAGQRVTILVQRGALQICYLTSSACFVKRNAKFVRTRTKYLPRKEYQQYLNLQIITCALAAAHVYAMIVRALWKEMMFGSFAGFAQGSCHLKCNNVDAFVNCSLNWDHPST